MAQRIRYLISLLFVFGFYSLASRAQGLPVATSAEVSVEFTVFAPRALKGVGYLPDTAGREPLRSLKFYNSYRSPVYSYRGASVIRFYDEAEVTAALEARAVAVDKTRVAPPRPVAECVLPEGVKKAFLLFFPKTDAAAGELKYDIFVMDDGEARLPAGHFMIINASGLEMVGNVNGQSLNIGRGLSAPIAAREGRVRLGMARAEASYSRLLLADEWSLGPRQRNLLVMFPPTRGNLLPNLVRLNDELPKDTKGMRLASADMR